MQREDKEVVFGMIYHNEPKNINSEWNCYGHWEIRLVKGEDGKVRNFPSAWDGHRFNNLTLRAQYHVKERMVSEIYGAEVAYKETTVNIRNADIMAKTLKQIHRKIDKMSESYGMPRDFGKYALYFLKAVGAQGFKMIKKDTGWSYDECEFISGRVGEIEHFIEVEMNKYSAKVEQKEAI